MLHNLKKKVLINLKALVFLSGILFVSSCLQRVDEANNQAYLINATSDTIVCRIGKDRFIYYNDSHLIPPHATLTLADALESSVFDIESSKGTINKDTIFVYRGDDSVVWSPPFRSLPSHIHSFYNKNAWTIKPGGFDDDYEIGTFVIYDNDFN